MTELEPDQIDRFLARHAVLDAEQRAKLRRAADRLTLESWLAVVDAVAADTTVKIEAAKAEAAHLALVEAFCAGWALSIGMCTHNGAPADPFAPTAIWAEWPRA